MKKVIRLSEKNWNTLHLIKLRKNLNSIDEVIDFLFEQLQINPETTSDLLNQFAKAQKIK
ncbi:MAG: hypothetical protein ACFFG0_18380 [Candidatus Thorarchaeota archaeon]